MSADPSTLVVPLEAAVLGVPGVTALFPSRSVPGVIRDAIPGAPARDRVQLRTTGAGLLRVRIEVGVDPATPVLATVHAVARAVRAVVAHDTPVAVEVRVDHVGGASPGAHGGVS